LNVTLGFFFPYRNNVYTNIGINVDGFITLNYDTPVYVFLNHFITNGSGSVYYRNVSAATDQTLIQKAVAKAYPSYSAFEPNNSFVITW
jgi:hypothetical protein